MGKIKETPDDETLHPHEILRQNLNRSSSKIITKDGKVKKKAPKQFTPYKCKVCNKKFTDKHNCATHEKIHSTETYSCPLCPYKGKTKKYLARHRQNIHGPPVLHHKCNVCGKEFQYKCSLKEHAMVHTGEKPHKCDVCGKTFRVLFSLHNHMHIHTNAKPYECSFCDYACRDNSTLRKHENRHMGIVKSFPCNICPKKFPEKAKLKRHIAQVHLDYLEVDLRSHKCDKCPKAFKSKYALGKHVEVVHDKLLACACPECGRRLSNKGNLAAHLRTHIHLRPYQCAHEGCHKRFKDKSALKKHSIIHAPHLHHPCGACGALFSRAYRRDAHQRRHRPRGKWAQCHHCGAEFYSKNYLIKHITTKHCPVKEKFICDTCGLVTYNKPSLVMHLKYGHGNEKDVKCKICKTKYKRFIYLKAHYLKTHNIRYKSTNKRKKEKKPEVEVKVEPVDEPRSGIQLQLLDVYKEEIVDEEEPDPDEDYRAYSKHVLSDDLAECILNQRGAPGNAFEEFLFEHVFNKQVKGEDIPSESTQNEGLINEEQRTLVTQKVKDIIKKAEEAEAAKLKERRRKREAKLLDRKLRREAKKMRRRRQLEIQELDRVRQMYNARMRAVVEERNRKEPAKLIKYFHQKPTEKANIKETHQTNNNINKETSANDDSLNYNKDLPNDKNDSSNDTNRENIANLNKNVSSNTQSDDINENDGLLNDINEIINHDINVSRNEMIGSLNKDIRDVTNDKTDSIDDLNETNDGENVTKESLDSNNAKTAIDSVNYASKNDSRNDENNDSNDDKSDDGSSYDPKPSESTGNKRLTFKTHQCYICFKLYPTKDDLISHCQSHFDICNATTLVKCPVCAHVGSSNITVKHMFKEHGVQIKIPYNKITDRQDNSEGSRYCYKMDEGDTIMEIIPSVKILNHHASVAIDKKNREQRVKTIAKTRLVKKGTEWVVEKVAVQISYTELPQFTEQELSKLPVSNSDVDRLGQLSRLAKNKGIKMLFPCNSCDKICQNFSALKLHGRQHDPDKKPFAPRKQNAKPAPPKKKPEVNLANRHAKPQPITHKHKCDEKLKKFYETHIRGADIEFWQFLKIYNKMDRENIRDFKDFEGRTEFGIHTNEDRSFNDAKPERSTKNKRQPISKKTWRSKSKSSLTNTSVVSPVSTPKLLTRSYTKYGTKSDSKLIQYNGRKPYKRVIMIGRKQHLEREKAKMKLREELNKRNK